MSFKDVQDVIRDSMDFLSVSDLLEEDDADTRYKISDTDREEPI